MVSQDRAVRTRQLVLDAAGIVFDQCGYSGASMAMIVAQGGGAFSQGALYFHFPTKRAIAVALIEMQNSRVQGSILASSAEGVAGMELILAGTRRYVEQICTDPIVRAGLRLAIEEQQLKPESVAPYVGWLDVVNTLLAQAQAEGDIAPEVDTEEASWHFNATFTGTQLMSGVLTDREDLLQRVGSAWKLTFPAVIVPSRLGHWLTRLEDVLSR